MTRNASGFLSQKESIERPENQRQRGNSVSFECDTLQFPITTSAQDFPVASANLLFSSPPDTRRHDTISAEGGVSSSAISKGVLFSSKKRKRLLSGVSTDSGAPIDNAAGTDGRPPVQLALGGSVVPEQSPEVSSEAAL
jgi:hypothetical protein